ncbi:MAG: hypothetical protein KAV87_52740, partial [Desulfobacteraceae bacterium]|nr:hypothetical protein [Desulfobacteraceae bacterium]
MPFDVQGSRDAGYSDDEIVSYLTKTSNFDLKSAQDVGYSNDEIINHLSGYDGPQPGPVIPGESISTTAGIPREEPTEPGFFETVGEDIGERAETIAGLVKRRAPSGEKSKFGAVAEIAAELPTTTALAAGQVAGGVLDVAGETIATGVKTIAKAITPDPVEEKIKAGVINVLETKAGQLGLRAMQKGAGAYRKFKEKNPDAALSLELIVNVTGLGIGKKATARTGKEIMDIGRDISAASTKAIPARIDRKIAKEVSHGINKGIRPTVVGKGTFSQTQQYYKKATNAVESIIENKANLQLVDKFGDTVSKLPESLKDFSMAIEQTKRNIFTQYDDLAKQAGAEFIDLQSVADDVFKISNNKSMQDFAPDVAKYADDLAQRLAKRGRYTTSEAQDAIATLNKSLESFYRNPSYDTAARASVDAGLVKLLRKKTDDVISTATGKQYQQLKSQYGALKTIEKEIN